MPDALTVTCPDCNTATLDADGLAYVTRVLTRHRRPIAAEEAIWRCGCATDDHSPSIVFTAPML